MAYELPAFKIPAMQVASSADLSSEQFHVVTLVGEGEVDLATSTDAPLGVLQNAPGAGESAEIMGLGITKVVAGSTIAAGEAIGISSAGLAEEFSGTAGEYQLGVAHTSASAADEVISASIECLNPVVNELSSV